MANCPITAGRGLSCNDAIAGLDAIYAIPYVADAFTINPLTLEVEEIDASITEAFKYELRADANVSVSDGVSDENTGVTLYTETLTIALKKQDNLTSYEVLKFQQGLHYIITQSKDGNYQLLGSLDGSRVTASNITSGGARSDFAGYNLTFSSFSVTPPPFLNEATVTALLAIVSENNINP